MPYLICDDKLSSKYQRKMDILSRDTKIYFSRYLKDILYSLRKGEYKIHFNNPWTLLIHSNNTDFQEFIIPLLKEFTTQSALKELILISTDDPLQNPVFEPEIKEITPNIKSFPYFTPDIYLNIYSWKKILQNNKIDKSFFYSNSLDYLKTISIICQGYLILYAATIRIETDIEDNDIVFALEKMGWYNLVEQEKDLKTSPFISQLFNKKEMLYSTNWWRNCLGISNKTDHQNFLDFFKKEWDENTNGLIPDVLIQLFDEIMEKDKIESPVKIARSYLAIAERLETR